MPGAGHLGAGARALHSPAFNVFEKEVTGMTLADRTITVLRDLHDELAAVTFALTDTQLTAASGGAPAWTVVQVLSHLGSGAEISSASYAAAVTGGTPPDGDFNRAVWDRWDAKSPRAQADGFVE